MQKCFILEPPSLLIHPSLRRNGTPISNSRYANNHPLVKLAAFWGKKQSPTYQANDNPSNKRPRPGQVKMMFFWISFSTIKLFNADFHILIGEDKIAHMIKRRKTQAITIGSVTLGTEHPIAIQSMTKCPTTDIETCLKQIDQLVKAGCAMVRLAVPRKVDTEALAKIVAHVSIPLIADIHFSKERAIEAIEAGIAKIRLNPGNLKDPFDLQTILAAAKAHGVAIRIGVNEASIRDLKGPDTATDRRVDLMLKEMTEYVKLFERQGFDQIVLSAKSSDSMRTIAINRRLAQCFAYPLHLGLTHAGLPEDARIPSAVTLGTLLAEGIGDTIRVSAAGDPIVETKMAVEILETLGLRQRQRPELIVCPTCGRTELGLLSLARDVKEALSDIHKAVRVAVMGCVVNGPGEAADADLAICAGKDKAFLYREGKRVAILNPENLSAAIKTHIDEL